MDLGEFLLLVEGNLMWQEEKLKVDMTLTEYHIDFMSWFSANIMLSSGNFKKGTSPVDIKAKLFQTEAERLQEAEEKSPKSVAEEKERLRKIFKLNKSDELSDS